MKTLTKTEDKAVSREPRQTFVNARADIYERPDGYYLEAEMPGVSKEGLDITVQSNELILTGRRTDPEPQGEVFYRESNRMDYRRVFELDPSIDVAKITARMDQGILKLTLPKTEAVQPRKITVE